MTSLGQIEKRLEIIKIAISITDEETISLQRLKLRKHRDNVQLNSILAVLDQGNYAQATNLIERYINVPKESDKKQKEIEAAKALKSLEEEKLIKKFGLFREEGWQKSNSDEELSSILDIPSIERVVNSMSMDKIEQIKENIQTQTEQQAAIHQEPNETLNHQTQGFQLEVYENLGVDAPKHDAYAQWRKAPEISVEESTPKEKSTQKESSAIIKDILSKEQASSKQKPKPPQPSTEDILAQFETIEIDHIPKKVETKSILNEFTAEEFIIKEYKIKTLEDELKPKNAVAETHQEAQKEKPILEVTETQTQEGHSDEDENNIVMTDDTVHDFEIEYDQIAYIDQRVNQMLNRYPQIEETKEKFESVEKLLYKISLDNGYTESDIVDAIEEMFDLISQNQLAEAARLLIAAAATESIYAQFILARELFRGRILQQNIPEAFSQISQLASEDYPEAVCDLAQFYEHGIGTPQNRKKAFRLYEDALDLGVERADMHLTRMESESRGFLSRLFKKK